MDFTTLLKYLEFIENEENYYAGAYEVIKACAVAQALKTALWDKGDITDDDLHFISDRINKAETRVIRVFEQWCIDRITESKRELSRENIVTSVFSALFGNRAL